MVSSLISQKTWYIPLSHVLCPAPSWPTEPAGQSKAACPLGSGVARRDSGSRAVCHGPGDLASLEVRIYWRCVQKGKWGVTGKGADKAKVCWGCCMFFFFFLVFGSFFVLFAFLLRHNPLATREINQSSPYRNVPKYAR